MSEIKTDKLTGYSNKNSVTVEDGATTMTIRQGLAKMYATADTNTANTLYGTLNISSLDDNAVGYHRFNTTNAVTTPARRFTRPTLITSPIQLRSVTLSQPAIPAHPRRDKVGNFCVQRDEISPPPVAHGTTA